MECLDTSDQSSAASVMAHGAGMPCAAGSEAFCDSAASQARKAVDFNNTEPPGEVSLKAKRAFMNDALVISKYMTGSAREAVESWLTIICA